MKRQCHTMWMHGKQAERHKSWDPLQKQVHGQEHTRNPVPNATHSSSGIIRLNMAIANTTTSVSTVRTHTFLYPFSTASATCRRSWHLLHHGSTEGRGRFHGSRGTGFMGAGFMGAGGQVSWEQGDRFHGNRFHGSRFHGSRGTGFMGAGGQVSWEQGARFLISTSAKEHKASLPVA